MDIATSKQRKKWESDIYRREQVAKAIDFYNNQQEDYTRDFLKETYKEKAYKKLQKYLKCDSITQNIIDDMSVMFQSGLSVTTGVPEADEFIKGVMEDTLFQSMMIKVDRLVNLTRKLAVVPYFIPEEDSFAFDIITGDKCFVKQHPKYPQIAEEVYYSTGAMLDSPQIADQTNLYTRYTREFKELVEIAGDGQVAKVLERTPNPYALYNMTPFVWFFDDLNIDTFWSEMGNRLVKDNLDINRLLTNLGLMLDYQTFSTLVTTGLNSAQPLYVGPQFHLNLIDKSYSTSSITPDAKYITPDAKINEVWGIICAKAVKCAKSVGLAADAYTTESTSNQQANSGYQLKLSKTDILNKNIMRKLFFVPSLTRLIRKLLITSNIYKNTSFRVDSMDIRVKIADPSFDLSEIETEQVRTMKIQNGTWSAVRSLQEDNPELSLDDCKKLLKEIKEENKLVVDNELFSPNIPPAGETQGEEVETE